MLKTKVTDADLLPVLEQWPFSNSKSRPKLGDALLSDNFGVWRGKGQIPKFERLKGTMGRRIADAHDGNAVAKAKHCW